ncbi:MAG: hypothetical protein OEN01_09380 [Candidatus Krumholzibacteria bacterium]|nr:hypothetical protein [Candidatus Krumholzibacteria bacterium]
MVDKRLRQLLNGGCIIIAMLLVSCGKSEDKKDESSTTLQEIAKLAAEEFTVGEEASAVEAMLESSGYVAKEYVNFPAQELGKKARMLVYTDKKGKSSGGVIYLKKTGATIAPAWHWYFEDMVPESVDKIELNDDGLWDIRVISKGGKQTEFTQGRSFALTAADRSDWIALNGVSSQPLSEDDAIWRCFDSDSSTAWRSTLAADGGAYIELMAPFGVEEGILTILTTGADQPKQCTLFADGKKIQQFELEPKAARQMIRLESGIKGAKRIRLVFDSTYGDGDVVSVAELELK